MNKLSFWNIFSATLTLLCIGFVLYTYMPSLRSGGLSNIDIIAVVGLILFAIPNVLQNLLMASIHLLGMCLYLGALWLGADRFFTIFSERTEIIVLLVFILLGTASVAIKISKRKNASSKEAKP